jgi:hypothetical protein
MEKSITQTMATCSHIDANDFYVVRFENDKAYYQGYASESKLNKLKESGFTFTFDQDHNWLESISETEDGIKITITFTISNY